jgi:hypothetical protein
MFTMSFNEGSPGLKKFASNNNFGDAGEGLEYRKIYENDRIKRNGNWNCIA